MNKLGIIYGGNTVESDYSRKAYAELKEKLKDRFHIVGIEVNTLIANNFKVSPLVKDMSYLSIVYGSPGQEGIVQGILEMLNISYIGSDSYTCSLVKNKSFCKNVLNANGVSVPKEYLIKKNDLDYPFLKKIVYPVVVKPNKMGGLSLGITICNDFSELLKGIQNAFQYDEEILLEEFIDGQEYTACVLDINGLGPKLLPLVKIEKKGQLSGSIEKIKGNRHLRINPEIDARTLGNIEDVILKIFKFLNLKHWAYFDLFIRGEEIILIEVGAVPGLTNKSNIPQILEYLGIELSEIVEKFIGGEKNV